MIKIKTYKIFSTFLLYPSEEFKNNITFAYDILKEEDILNLNHLDDLLIFINFVKDNELLFLQEYYVSLFDRQKDFSLYLFEHIHGDSRERGMAMIDLKNLYKSSNFDIAIGGELPDYLPIFLEYLSILSNDKSIILFGEIVNILAILYNRLKIANSPYYIIFFILESLSAVRSDESLINKFIQNTDYSNDKNKFIDKNWDDPKVF